MPKHAALAAATRAPLPARARGAASLGPGPAGGLVMAMSFVVVGVFGLALAAMFALVGVLAFPPLPTQAGVLGDATAMGADACRPEVPMDRPGLGQG